MFFFIIEHEDLVGSVLFAFRMICKWQFVYFTRGYK